MCRLCVPKNSPAICRKYADVVPGFIARYVVHSVEKACEKDYYQATEYPEQVFYHCTFVSRKIFILSWNTRLPFTAGLTS